MDFISELDNCIALLNNGQPSTKIEMPHLSSKLEEIKKLSDSEKRKQTDILYKSIRNPVKQMIYDNNENYFHKPGELQTSINCSKKNLCYLLSLEIVGNYIDTALGATYSQEIYNEIYSMSLLLEEIAPNTDFYRDLQDRVLEKIDAIGTKEKTSTESLFLSSKHLFWNNFYHNHNVNELETYRNVHYWGWVVPFWGIIRIPIIIIIWYFLKNFLISLNFSLSWQNWFLWIFLFLTMVPQSILGTRITASAAVLYRSKNFNKYLMNRYKNRTEALNYDIAQKKEKIQEAFTCK